MQASEEIKAKLDIIDLIREYIPLKAAGVNFRAKCPFHREKTPSFTVSPEKQIYHCFGCGKGGDIFSFIQEIESVDFVGALKILAPKAGVVLKRQDPKATSERNRVLDIIDIARRYYNKILIDNNQAKAARQYLKERGLKEETIDEWQIGFSPDSWDSLSKILLGKGYAEHEIFKAGMNVKNSTSSRFYDRFRGRIMFPINDVNVTTVGFSARVSPEKEAEEKMGKYINSPQTVVYDKSRILFGLDKAKQEIRISDYVIVVEGQMDVITAHQAGFKNVVASSGTALTAHQVILLKRFTNNIMLAFDMDEAGATASDRGIQEALKQEMNIKVVELKNGKDPDDCIKEDKEAWVEAVKTAKPMMQYYFDRTFSGMDLSDIVKRREAASILLNIIIKIGNRIEQDHWLKKLSEKIDVSESILRETISKSIKTTVKKNYEKTGARPEPEIQAKPQTREEKISEMIIGLAMKYPFLIEYSQNHLKPEILHKEELRELYKNLLFYYNNIITDQSLDSGADAEDTINFEFQLFKDWLTLKLEDSFSGENSDINNEKKQSSQLMLLDRLALLADEEYYDFEENKAKEEIIRLSIVLQRFYISASMKDIENAIARAETEKDTEKINSLLKEFKALADELKNILQ